MATPDLTEFELLRLTITAKASNAGLRIAFVFPSVYRSARRPGQTSCPLFRSVGHCYSQDWRADAAWIGEQALNKPVS